MPLEVHILNAANVYLKCRNDCWKRRIGDKCGKCFCPHKGVILPGASLKALEQNAELASRSAALEILPSPMATNYFIIIYYSDECVSKLSSSHASHHFYHLPFVPFRSPLTVEFVRLIELHMLHIVSFAKLTYEHCTVVLYIENSIKFLFVSITQPIYYFYCVWMIFAVWWAKAPTSKNFSISHFLTSHFTFRFEGITAESSSSD